MSIDKYLFIPFKDGGRDFSGCDCWGLVLLFYKTEFGIKLPDYRISCENISAINNRVNIQRSEWVCIEKPKMPCVITMRVDENPKFVNHIGIYIGNGEFLDTSKKRGVCVTPIDHPFWKYHIEGYYVPILQ